MKLYSIKNKDAILVTDKDQVQFKKLEGPTQLPIEPLNKPHKRNTFNLTVLGIDEGEWKYHLSEEDIRSIELDKELEFAINNSE